MSSILKHDSAKKRPASSGLEGLRCRVQQKNPIILYDAWIIMSLRHNNMSQTRAQPSSEREACIGFTLSFCPESTAILCWKGQHAHIQETSQLNIDLPNRTSPA